jgi:vitamin B12 transporter
MGIRCCNIKIFASLLFVVVICCTPTLYAQTKRAASLDTIFAQHKQHKIGLTAVQQSIDSSALSTTNNLAQALQNHSAVFIKNTGPATASTPSLRGSSSSQIAVLWNGININYLSLGMSDFSLYNSFLLDNIQVQHGGNSAAWGSGDIGGTVHLNNILSTQQHQYAVIKLSANTNNSFTTALQLSAAKKQLATSTKIIWQQGPNDYRYRNNDTSINKAAYLRMSNAAINLLNVLQENAYQINDYYRLDAKVWLSANQRQLPASIYVAKSTQAQTDNALRAMMDLQYKRNKLLSNYKLCFSREFMQYSDPSKQLLSDYYTTQVFAEADGICRMRNNQHLNYGIALQHANMLTTIYDSNANQTRFTLRGGYSMSYKQLNMRALLRQELVNGKLIPLVGNLSADVNINKKSVLSFALVKNYRLPSFNDLFWAAGGNINLLSENSIAQDLAYKFTTPKQQLTLALYNRAVTNWIQWTPSSNGQWQANNVAKVWSRGVELIYQNQLIKTQRHQLHGNLIYAFNKSTATQHSNTEAIGKQLVYTPLHKANCNLNYIYKSYQIQLMQQFASCSFTTTDNLNFVKAYASTDVHLGKQVSIKHKQVNAQLRIINLFNANYWVVDGWPMPARHLQLDITCKF